MFARWMICYITRTWAASFREQRGVTGRRSSWKDKPERGASWGGVKKAQFARHISGEGTAGDQARPQSSTGWDYAVGTGQKEANDMVGQSGPVIPDFETDFGFVARDTNRDEGPPVSGDRCCRVYCQIEKDSKQGRWIAGEGEARIDLCSEIDVPPPRKRFDFDETHDL
ncbi:hypothetical protein R5H30_07710 [Sulfitobacter sp. D35]|nr:hypothetical protein [Sulfitobacter sp. D35]MDW4497860.1 hypothetical protein [Sulfitobacter sp. D35]